MRVVIVVAALVAAILPAAVVAQELPDKTVSVRNRPRPEYAPVGHNLGGAQLNSTLNVGVAHDDNVYATEDDRVSDWLAVTGFDVGIQTTGRVALGVSANVESTRYFQNTQENYVDWGASSSIGMGAGTPSQLGLGASFARSRESRSDPSSPDDALEPVSYDVAGADLAFTRSFASGRLELTADYKYTNYEDVLAAGSSLIDQDFRDRNTLVYAARLDMGVARSVATFARLVHTEQMYRWSDGSGIDRDSDTNAFFGGAALNLTNLVRGEIGLGVLHLDNKDPLQGDQTSLAIGTRLEFYVTQLVTATLDVQRTSGASDIAGSASYVGTTLGVGLDYEMRRNLILSLNLGASQRDYTGAVGGKDRTKLGELQAQWLLNRRATVVFGYTYTDRSSPAQSVGRNFDRSVFAANLKLNL